MTTMPAADKILERYRALVDQHIARLIDSRPPISLYEMARYHLGLDADGDRAIHSGKRVRAALCLLSCAAAGGSAEAAAPAAAALELVHGFTLLHDDVADRDQTRRGRPAVWTRWGVGQAVTAGDALFALANVALEPTAGTTVSPQIAVEVASDLNQAVLAVCEGQHLDIAHEGRDDIAVPDYLEMIDRKTAALFAAACAMGARLGSAHPCQRDALRAFGRHLGLAFQIRDDALGIWGDPADLGKPVGGDLRRNKRSLPVVYALSEAPEAERAWFADQLHAGIASDDRAAELASWLDRRGARAFCDRKAREHLSQALEGLSVAELREAPAADLRVLASYLVERTE
jgi:geranylgeranyl diphosphate synthase type I